MVTITKWSQSSIFVTKKCLLSYVDFFQCISRLRFEKKSPTCLKSTKTWKQKRFCDQNDKINMTTGGSETKDHYLTKNQNRNQPLSKCRSNRWKNLLTSTSGLLKMLFAYMLPSKMAIMRIPTRATRSWNLLLHEPPSSSSCLPTTAGLAASIRGCVSSVLMVCLLTVIASQHNVYQTY